MLLFVLTFCQMTPLSAKRHAHRTPPADIGSRPSRLPVPERSDELHGAFR